MKNLKYKLIENELRSKIKSKEYLPGFKLPTEEELCEKYEVSRITVRKALNNLSMEGLIIKRTGDGTYVFESTIVNGDARRKSFTEELVSNGITPGVEVISFKVIKAETEEYIKQTMNLDDNDTLFVMIKIRTGDNIPIALSKTYVPTKLVPVEDVEEIQNKSLYKYMNNKYGIDLDGPIWRTISAVMPTRTQKKLLHISDEPLLKILHSTNLKDGRIFEFSETLYVSSRFVYKTNR